MPRSIILFKEGPTIVCYRQKRPF